ncbi:Heterogeneous nuclear ribonucleoprotein 1, partial [Cucurbita argyrosperma subsp. sororia]
MAEEKNFNADHNAYHGGDGAVQMYDQQDRFELGSELEGGNADSTGGEVKHSTSHYDSSSSGKLFVGGVSWETTEETFSDYFSKYGEIADSVIMMDKHTGRPRGFGFVTFCDPSVADMVLNKDHVIDGRTVEVKRTVPRADTNNKLVSRTKKIFVGGIPPALTEDAFKVYFSSFGTITEHQIMIDYRTKRSRGFGFITFENEDAVESIFAGNEKHELGGKQVEIKKAIPRRVSYDSHSNNTAAPPSSGYGMYKCEGLYDDKMGRPFGRYDVYAPFGRYGGNYANFYGAYNYGFGYGGPMYINGIGRYGMTGYGVPNCYGCTMAERYHPYWY